MNREGREARMRGAGTRKVAPVKLVIQGTTPGSVSTTGFTAQQKEAQTPTPFERGQRRQGVLPSLEEDFGQEGHDVQDNIEYEPEYDQGLDEAHEEHVQEHEVEHQNAITSVAAASEYSPRILSTSPPEFNLTRDFESPPPAEEVIVQTVIDEDALDLSFHQEQYNVSDSDDEFVPDSSPRQKLSPRPSPRPSPPRLSPPRDLHSSPTSPPPRHPQPSRENYAERIHSYKDNEEESSRPPSRSEPPAKKLKKAIALEVNQLDTDEAEFSPRVTMVDFVSQMVLETLQQELGKTADDEQKHVIEAYMAQLNHRFLELCDINNAVYMQRSRVAKLIRTKNSAQEALLKVNENLNEARVETDRKRREYERKKRTWDDTRFVNEFLHDVEDVNNSIKGVESTGVKYTPGVFDKLAKIEQQTQLLGKLRRLNGLLEGFSQSKG
ncbi:hypothetical protein CJU90_4832 [Yarrowia sp. C11]|nr:hypothetical protein CJU90_4832 [Yarrowia sp. C11]